MLFSSPTLSPTTSVCCKERAKKEEGPHDLKLEPSGKRALASVWRALPSPSSYHHFQYYSYPPCHEGLPRKGPRTHEFISSMLGKVVFIDKRLPAMGSSASFSERFRSDFNTP